MATNFLKFCRAGSVDGMAFVVGVSSVECVASVGRIYTWSVEGRCKLCFWSSSTASLPLPSSVNIGEVSSFFSHGQTANDYGASCSSLEVCNSSSIKSS